MAGGGSPKKQGTEGLPGFAVRKKEKKKAPPRMLSEVPPKLQSHMEINQTYYLDRSFEFGNKSTLPKRFFPL